MIWQEQAACNGIDDPEVFFLDQSRNDRKAKLICQDCPVRTECLLDALANGEYFGVLGGKTGPERQAIHRGAPIAWKRVKCHNKHDLAITGIDDAGNCLECDRRSGRTVRNLRKLSA